MTHFINGAGRITCPFCNHFSGVRTIRTTPKGIVCVCSICSHNFTRFHQHQDQQQQGRGRA